MSRSARRRRPRPREKRFAAAIVRPDPAAPINLVEEPVHDHEQHDDREQSGGGLQIQRGDVVGERAHDADCDHPGDKCRDEGERGSPGDRPPVGPRGADHAGGDRREDENAFEPFAEDEHADVEDGDGGLVLARIGSGEPRSVSPCQVIKEHAERGEKEQNP